MTRASSLAMLLMLTLSTLSPLGVAAQEEQPAQEAEESEDVDPEDRASAFRAVSGPQIDQVPGGTLLVIAYGVIFALLLGYLWRLGALHAKNAVALERLETSLRQDEGGE